MLLNLLYSQISQPILWLTLYESVNEISCLIAPLIRHLWPFDLYLLSQYLVPDLFAGLACVGSLFRTQSYFAKHQLINNDTKREIVRNILVILSTQNLRCYVKIASTHIAGSTTSIHRVNWFIESSNSQIGYSNITFPIQYEIFRLYITVNDVFTMQILQSKDNTCHKKLWIWDWITCLYLRKFLFGSYVVTQISTRHKIHN
jgi:hypothetical protein